MACLQFGKKKLGPHQIRTIKILSVTNVVQCHFIFLIVLVNVFFIKTKIKLKKLR